MLNTSLNFSFNSPDMLTTTTAVEKGYLLTSVTGLYLGLRYTNHSGRGDIFFKVIRSLQSRCFFLNCNPEVHGGEAGKGNWGKEKKEKTPASRAYESAKCPLINCD